MPGPEQSDAFLDCSSRRLADGEVEDHGRGDERDDVAAGGDTSAVLVQIAGDAACGLQSEGGTAGQQDAVDLLDSVLGAQQIRLTGAGRRASDIDASHGVRRAEDRGAAGRGAAVGPVADADPSDVRDRIEQR